MYYSLGLVELVEVYRNGDSSSGTGSGFSVMRLWFYTGHLHDGSRGVETT